MGQYLFRLPDIGEGVVEAEIAAWHVKVGDHIKEDQPLLDVVTDKATVDMTSPVEGTVTVLHGHVGARAPVGSVLVEMDVSGAAESANLAKPGVGQNGLATVAKPAEVIPMPHADSPAASPATRRRATEWGVNLEEVKGSGPGGRILTEDVERHRAAASEKKAMREDVEKIKIIGERHQIAERMVQAKRQIPHFSYVE